MNRCCPDFDFDLNLGPDFEHFVSSAKEAARQFGEWLHERTDKEAPFGFDPFYRPEPRMREGFSPHFNAYPQANIYKNAEGALVLEFALAGVDESTIKIGFQGDFLVLSARMATGSGAEDARYQRRSYRPRDVERQKYLVPAEDYEQMNAKAVFKAGLLTVTVPPKDIPEADAIRITIVKEGT
jgi:HSP20 family protein